jgi:hypothetical protein
MSIVALDWLTSASKRMDRKDESADGFAVADDTCCAADCIFATG